MALEELGGVEKGCPKGEAEGYDLALRVLANVVEGAFFWLEMGGWELMRMQGMRTSDWGEWRKRSRRIGALGGSTTTRAISSLAAVGQRTMSSCTSTARTHSFVCVSCRALPRASPPSPRGPY